MPETNETYARIQSVRIKHLEQQVHLMQRELQRLRQGVLHQNDVEKFSTLMERLKELNSILIDLRNYYNNSMQQSMFKQNKIMLNSINTGTNNLYTVQPKESSASNNVSILVKNNKQEEINAKRKEPQAFIDDKNVYLWNDKYHENFFRENAGFDQQESSKETLLESQLIEHKIKAAGTREENNDPFKTCKQLMEESKPPSSILGNYLMRLQDFRADPELRRQRWKRKQQEKLQQQPRRMVLQDKATLTEGHNLTSSLASLAEAKALNNHDHENIKENRNYTSSVEFDENDSVLALSLPVIKYNLKEVIDEIISKIARKDIALTIVLENDLYHVSVSQISTGSVLSCLLATEAAIQEARLQQVFQDLLTFFVVNAENSKSQKDRILGHLFEFIKMDVK